jgi:hypothetical protein
VVTVGLMRQEIYKDPHGLDAWDKTQTARCFVHLANSAVYRQITGCVARPQSPSRPNVTGKPVSPSSSTTVVMRRHWRVLRDC